MGLMVILDAGHGVDTPGKRSPDGRLREGRWARAMAARLAGARVAVLGLGEGADALRWDRAAGRWRPAREGDVVAG